MPLCALIDGREVHVWDLTHEDWAALRLRSRAEAAAVLMACCGRHGTAKTSRNGNPFFAHRPRPGPIAASCRWAAESTAHAACKLLAAAGARAAGWAVRTEAAAPDGSWRADVLCRRGAVRVALEIQLARPAPGELRARQGRYRAAGVRGAWFLPAALRPASSHALPAFALEMVDGAARVGLGGGTAGSPERMVPLDEFVAHLLRGRVRFEPERAVRPLGCPVLVGAPDGCRRCGGRFEHVVGVTNVATTTARPRYHIEGIAVTVLRDLWEADRRLARPVAEGVGRLRRGEPRLSPVALRRCPVVGEAYLMALCPRCGATQGDGAVDRVLTSLHPRAPIRVPIPPAPLAFRPLDGRPPRAEMGDWGEVVVPAGWRLTGDEAADAWPQPPPRGLVARRLDGHLRPA